MISQLGSAKSQQANESIILLMALLAYTAIFSSSIDSSSAASLYIWTFSYNFKSLLYLFNSRLNA